MSSSANSSSNGSGQMNRQPAKRAFAEEFRDATEIFQDGEDERSPKFAMLPTGELANRVLAIGTLTEAADIGTKSEYWQARVVDPTGTFFIYAGQYQPEAMAALRGMETPEYVAVVGKPRSYETDDGDTLVSLTPESITVVEQGTRDAWVVETAEQTLARIEAMEADEGEEGEEVVRAQEVYPDVEMGDYEQEVKEALAQVAGIEIESESESEDGDSEASE